MIGILIFIFALSNSYAQQAPQPKTESEVQCLKDVKDKFDSIQQYQGACKWELPKDAGTDRFVGVEPQCSAYEKIGKRYEPRKYVYSDGQYRGTLVCGNTQNANKESYKQQSPVFAYQCSQCSTTDNSGGVDASCLQSMQETDMANCVGGPKMKYKHERGKSTNVETGATIEK